MGKCRIYWLLTLTSLLFFYTFALNNIYNVLSKHFIDSFYLTPSEAGFISSLFFYGNIIFLVPAGIFCDKFPLKKLVFTVVVICSSLTLLTGFVSNAIELGFLRFLTGICGAFGFIGCLKVATGLFEQKDLSKAAGIIATMGMFGGLMVQTPLAYLIHNTSWRISLVIIGVIGYIISIVIFFALRNVVFTFHSSQEKSISITKNLKTVFLKPQNLLYASYTTLMNLPIYMLGAMWGIPYLMGTGNFTEIQAATICGMLFIGMMFGSSTIGIIADFFKTKRNIMLLGAILSIIIMLIIFREGFHYSLMLLLFFLLGAITSTQILSYPLMVQHNPAHLSGIATSVISIISLLGGAIAQPLFGSLLSYFSINNEITSYSYSMAIYSLLIAFIGAMVLSLFIKEEVKK